jgi:hypothetical protein
MPRDWASKIVRYQILDLPETSKNKWTNETKLRETETFAKKLTPLVDHLTRESDSVLLGAVCGLSTHRNRVPNSWTASGNSRSPRVNQFTTHERVALVEVGGSTVGGYFEMITSLQHGLFNLPPEQVLTFVWHLSASVRIYTLEQLKPPNLPRS